MRPVLLVASLFLVACDAPATSVPDAQDAPPTWHADVAPLLVDHCSSCHRDGGIGPFSIETYDEARSWGPALLASVEDGTMPPFDARETETCTPPLPWKDDPRLDEAEIDLLRAWVDAGHPEGDPKDAPSDPVARVDDIEDPDAIVQLAQPFTVDGDRDLYHCFRVEVPNDEDVFLTALQVLPDNDAVVHHVLVWKDPDDLSAARAGDDGAYPCSGTPDIFPTELVGAWTPGGGVIRTPEGTGTPFTKGSTLVLNVHYHPTGAGPEVDQTAVALDWTTEPPDKFITWFLVDLPFGAQSVPSEDDVEGWPSFHIPAGASEHTETVILNPGPFLPFEVPIYAITPHMHYLGRDMQVRILRDGPYAEDTCLVHTPGYRFDWQTSYTYDGSLDELPRVLPGDRIEVRCTYDNSWSNPYMADALDAAGADEPFDVTWGEETSDEMCMAMVGLVLPPIDLGDLVGSILSQF